MNERKPKKHYNAHVASLIVKESIKQFDKYLDDYDVYRGSTSQIASYLKRDFLLGLCERLDGKIGVSDDQRRMISREIRGINYVNKKDDSVSIFADEKKEYVLYPNNIYAYRAHSKEDSLIVISGNFKGDLTDEEKSWRHSERLFKSNGLISLLLTCPPFNPLFLFPYGSQAPKSEDIPEGMSNLLFEDFQEVQEILKKQ